MEKTFYMDDNSSSFSKREKLELMREKGESDDHFWKDFELEGSPEEIMFDSQMPEVESWDVYAANKANQEYVESIDSVGLRANPAIDPVNLMGGGLMAVGKYGLKTGLSMLTGMVASEVPIGLGIEQVERLTDNNPYFSTLAGLALPLAAGRYLEPHVSRAASKTASALAEDFAHMLSGGPMPFGVFQRQIGSVGDFAAVDMYNKYINQYESGLRAGDMFPDKPPIVLKGQGQDNAQAIVDHLNRIGEPVPREYEGHTWNDLLGIARGMHKANLGLDPVIDMAKRGYQGDASGDFPFVWGNNKTAFPCGSFPGGKVTYDSPGCGKTLETDIRNAWMAENYPEVEQLNPVACYTKAGSNSPECYVQTGRARYGEDPASLMQNKSVGGKAERAEMESFIQKNGKEAAQEAFPGIDMKFYGDGVSIKKGDGSPMRSAEDRALKQEALGYMEQNGMAATKKKYKGLNIGFKGSRKSEWSFTQKIHRPGGTSYGNLEHVPIGNYGPVAARHGVTSTGELMFTPEMIKALEVASPGWNIAIQAGYHKMPGLHMDTPLKDRTMVNSTISGWFSPIEFLQRIMNSDDIRDAGWNTTLRYVNADPRVHPAEAARFNKYLEPVLHSTDYGVMGQPLHTGDGLATIYGRNPGIPGCCESPVKGYERKCLDCDTGDAIGKGFTDFWELPRFEKPY